MAVKRIMVDERGVTQRRAFFREAARRIVGPLADYLDDEPKAPPRDFIWLRPPGAIEEQKFIDTCRRCGACVNSCPAQAIFPLGEARGAAAGTPVIDADLAACVVCEGLRCTTVCPSGALLELTNPADIRMGIAEVYAPVCVRSKGDSCDLCVERCPIGDVAIAFVDDGPPEIRAAGCVGCGMCQLYCPTSPKAITVRPLVEE
jgi:ferredoxin